MNQLPKKHTSPSHLQKQQEKSLNFQAQQLLQQIPAKNLRNPDAFVTSILKNPANLSGSQVFLNISLYFFEISRHLVAILQGISRKTQKLAHFARNSKLVSANTW